MISTTRPRASNAAAQRLLAGHGAHSEKEARSRDTAIKFLAGD